MRIRLLFACALVACGEQPSPSDDTTTDPARERLVAWMSGSFSSTAPAQADADDFDTHLPMAPIGTERTDGRWRYVEQSPAQVPERPYRQRVYPVLRVAEGFERRIFELEEPLRCTGAWRQDAPLADVAPTT